MRGLVDSLLVIKATLKVASSELVVVKFGGLGQLARVLVTPA